MSPARAAALLAALLAAGCASRPLVLDAPIALPQPVELPEGAGAVVGSILLSAPTGPTDAADQQIVSALNSRQFEAILAPDGSGERYRVRFFAGVEKRFALRAPAGGYSVESIVSIGPPNLGERHGSCRLGRVARLSVLSGQVTYVGRLWLIADFKPDRGGAAAQSLRELGVPESELAEAALELRVSAIDRGDEVRDKLLLGEGGRRVGTELMSPSRGTGWDCVPRPP